MLPGHLGAHVYLDIPNFADLATMTAEGEDYRRVIQALHIYEREVARIVEGRRNLADHDAVRELGRDIVVQGFAILNDALGAKPYLSGSFSVADPILFYVEFWADKTGIALPDNLAAHYRRMLARPAVQQVLREEGYNPATLGTLCGSRADTAASRHFASRGQRLAMIAEIDAAKDGAASERIKRRLHLFVLAVFRDQF